MSRKGYTKGNETEEVDENTIGIVIVRRNGDRHVALVDRDVYYEKNLSSITFGVNTDSRYVGTTIKHPDGGYRKDGQPRTTLIRLHHILIQSEEGKVCDHIDGNTLNNRLSNLQNVTQKQNSENRKKRGKSSSQYLGVCFLKKRNKFRSSIRISKRTMYLGNFSCERDAAVAYDRAVVEYRELRAPRRQLNFPGNLQQYREELRK